MPVWADKMSWFCTRSNGKKLKGYINLFKEVLHLSRQFGGYAIKYKNDLLLSAFSFSV